MYSHFIRTALLLLCGIFIFSCGKPRPERKQRIGDEYFSVTQFLDDQWGNLEGQPYVFRRITDNGEGKDTTAMELTEKLFREIRMSFDESDISDSIFKDTFNFEIIEDMPNGLINLNYTAKSPDEYTQKLMVVMDGYTRRVKSIYVETVEDGTFSYASKKLNYIPFRSISIQEYKKSFLSSGKTSHTVYLFPSKYD